MKNLLAGLMILAAAAVFLVSHCAQGDAQSVQVGGEQQQRNTQMTTSTTKKFDPVTGKEIGEDKVSTNIGLPTIPNGEYKYSGIPCKWFRGSAKAEKETTEKK